MTLAMVLSGAQKLLAERGWSEGLDALAEVGPFSALGAIAASAQQARQVPDAVELLEAVVLPAVASYNDLGDEILGPHVFADIGPFLQLAAEAAKCISVQAWLEQPGRTQAQVLRAFDLAILKAQSVEAA